MCQTDFLATFAEMLAVELPSNAGEDSVSFYAALTGGKTERGPIIHHSASGQFAIRVGSWKLIVNGGSGRSNGSKKKNARRAAGPRYELYDLTDRSLRGEQRGGRASGSREVDGCDARTHPGWPGLILVCLAHPTSSFSLRRGIPQRQRCAAF